MNKSGSIFFFRKMKGGFVIFAINDFKNKSYKLNFNIRPNWVKI